MVNDEKILVIPKPVRWITVVDKNAFGAVYKRWKTVV